MENKIKTPYYLYSESVIKTQIASLINSELRLDNIHYSLMANNNLEILKIIKNQGLGVFTSTLTELNLALKVGFKENQIIFCASNLHDTEISIICDIRPIIIADSLKQLKKYVESRKINEIGIRISFDKQFYKTFGLFDIHRQGIEEEEWSQIQNYCKDHFVKIIGLHTYIGTNITDTELFKKGIDKLVNNFTGYDDMEFIDISGGFGLEYNKFEQDFSVNDLVKHFKNEISKINNKIQIKVEPGRFIMGSAGKLLCSVTEVKEKDGLVFIGVDTNLSNFPRPYIYKEQHLITIEKRMKDTDRFFNNVYICGNSAKSDDFLFSTDSFPVVEEGDILCIHHAGAYCYSMSSNFCALLRPAEYLLKESGQVIKIRNEETLETLLEGQEI